MNRIAVLACAAVVAGLLVSPALAGVVVVQGSSAPVYGTTLNFDEPGGPTGADVPNNSWSGAPWGITEFMSGGGNNLVGDISAYTGQTTNAYYGPWGVFIKFSQDLTEMSFDAWDTSGPPSPFGGGMAVVLINDGDESNLVYFNSFTPAIAGTGLPSFNITTDSGTVFDEVRILGFGFFPETVVDNLSWNAIPEPGTLSLLALGIVGLIRRRAK